MTHLNKFISSLAISGMFFGATIQAQEKTGGQVQELIQEMNDEIAAARKKIEVLDAERARSQQANPKDALKKRKKALKALEQSVEKMNAADNENERKAYSRQVEEKVVRVSEISADYLTGMKIGLNNQDKQMKLMEEVLSGIIYKLDKLHELAEKRGTSSKSDKEISETKNKIKSMAHMVEMLSQATPQTQRWKGVRQTLVLQNAMLKRSKINGDKLRQRLKSQKQSYEQALAQISEARMRLETDKQLLAELALGEVAQSSLRQVAGLLLGNMNIGNIGENILAKSEKRQESLLQFLDQGENGGGSSLDVSEDIDDEHPTGFAELLD